MIQYVRKNTRFRPGQQPQPPDHVITKYENDSQSSCLHTLLNKMDHVTITFTFRFRQETRFEKLFRSMGKMKLENLKARADLLDWVIGNENADVKAKYYENIHQLQEVFHLLDKNKVKS